MYFTTKENSFEFISSKVDKLDPDLHSFYLLNPDPHSEKLLDPDRHKIKRRIHSPNVKSIFLTKLFSCTKSFGREDNFNPFVTIVLLLVHGRSKVLLSSLTVNFNSCSLERVTCHVT